MGSGFYDNHTYTKLSTARPAHFKATAKRIKRRGSGLLKRKKAYGTHKLGKRSTKRKRELRKNLPGVAANLENVRRSLGMK